MVLSEEMAPLPGKPPLLLRLLNFDLSLSFATERGYFLPHFRFHKVSQPRYCSPPTKQAKRRCFQYLSLTPRRWMLA